MASSRSADPPATKKRKLNTDTMSPISRVLHSSDHFEILELPKPRLDELDRVVWFTQNSDIKKQYFKISRQVHPDRHIGDDNQSKRAADSFDIVQNAFQTLSDDTKREEYLNEYAKTLKYKASKSKFDGHHHSEQVDFDHNKSDNKTNNDTNDDEEGTTKSKLSSLEQQTLDLERSQKKRKRKRALIEKEKSEYEQGVMEAFQERRKRAEMQRIRAKQNQKKRRYVPPVDKESDPSDSDDECDYSQTLAKLKRKQKGSKRRRR